jgi:general secretion pathway protein M
MMKRWIPHRIAVYQAVIVAAFVLPALAFAHFVWGQHQSATQKLAEMEPRFARLLGLVERKSELLAFSQMSAEFVKSSLYPADQDATLAGNDAQQRIRTVFADSRLDVISIQVLAAKEEEGFDRIPIDLRVEGDLTGLQNALAVLAAQKPLVLVDEATIQTVGAVRPASVQKLGGQFQFSVFRVRP